MFAFPRSFPFDTFSDLILYFFSLKTVEYACGGIREDAATPLQTPWFTVQTHTFLISNPSICIAGHGDCI
jgi:hypothetical protein